MEDQRNFANIERRLEPGQDGQQLQQFMSCGRRREIPRKRPV
jgi:hypothetical protein